MAELEAIGITTANQAASLRFYGLLGVEVPEPGEDHVEAPVRGGVQLMWDTEELIRQIEPDLPSPVRQRIVLAFRCADPADVDATYERVVDAGFEQGRALGCVLGSALRIPARPGREHGRPVRAARINPQRLSGGR